MSEQIEYPAPILVKRVMDSISEQFRDHSGPLFTLRVYREVGPQLERVEIEIAGPDDAPDDLEDRDKHLINREKGILLLISLQGESAGVIAKIGWWFARSPGRLTTIDVIDPEAIDGQVRKAVRELLALGDSLRPTDTRTLPDESKATLPTKVLSGVGHG